MFITVEHCRRSQSPNEQILYRALLQCNSLSAAIALYSDIDLIYNIRLLFKAVLFQPIHQCRMRMSLIINTHMNTKGI